MKIAAWDRRTCHRCGRVRVHYRLYSKPGWRCFGTLPDEMRGKFAAACGKPVVIP